MNKKLIISLALSIIGIVLILPNKGIDIDEDRWCSAVLHKNLLDKEFYTRVKFNDPHYFLTAKDRENYACFGYTHVLDDMPAKILLEKEDIDHLGSDNVHRRSVLIGSIILIPSLIVVVIQLKLIKKNRGERR